MKKLFKNAPWKTWKTRKIAFISVCLIWIMYAIRGLLGLEIDSSILEFVYEAGVWILGCGTVIVVSDTVSDKILLHNTNNEQ